MPESFLANEIDRYIVVPGQALAYLTGKRELLRLREEASSRLARASRSRASTPPCSTAAPFRCPCSTTRSGRGKALHRRTDHPERVAQAQGDCSSGYAKHPGNLRLGSPTRGQHAFSWTIASPTPGPPDRAIGMATSGSRHPGRRSCSARSRSPRRSPSCVDTDLFSAPAGLTPSSENVFHHSSRLDWSSAHALSGRDSGGRDGPRCRLPVPDRQSTAGREPRWPRGRAVPTLGTDRWRTETVSGAAGAVPRRPRENHPSRLAATGRQRVQGLAQ